MTGAKRAAATPLGRGQFGELTRGRLGWILLDAAAILALLALVALAFYPVYGTPWLFVTVLGFGAVGIGIAVLATYRRFGTGAIALVSIAVWFLLGGFLTMPSSTIAMVVPTTRTLFGLLVGPVTAWRDMLTLEPPIGETFNLLVVPGLVALVAGLAAMLISLRSTRPMLAWIPPALGYVVGATVGSQVAFRPLLVGAAFFVIVLLWTSHRRAVARGRFAQVAAGLKPVQGVLALVTLLVAGLAAVAVVPAIAGDPDRDNLRALMEPPIDLEQYASPLQGYRANITQQRQSVLFEASGAQTGDVIRLATLDRYDGLSYRVSTTADQEVEETTFTRVGQWIHDDTEGQDRSVGVNIRNYRGVWVPTVGRTTSIDFDGERSIGLGENFFYNRSTATGLNTIGLQEGDSYVLGVRVKARPSDQEIAGARAGTFPLPESTGVPDELRNRARQWAEAAATPGAAALIIEENLRKGFFSHGQPDEAKSAAGHTERRLINLLAEPDRMVGDHEQYAVVMALMARELGIPARVIYGYQSTGIPGITGEQVGAWPELYFQHHGWVMFDPTPPETQTLDVEDQPKPPEPQPYIENPPPPPLRPEIPPPDEQLPIDPGEPPVEEDTIDWAQIGALAALTGIPLVTIVVPIALILGLKMRRRARRRNDPVVANRIAGAWSELVDRARDVGKSPSVSATRSEQAEGLIDDFAKLRGTTDPVALAKEADWIVFAPGDPSAQTAKEYWGSSSSIKRGMRKSTNPFTWLASYLSTKSFRKIR